MHAAKRSLIRCGGSLHVAVPQAHRDLMHALEGDMLMLEVIPAESLHIIQNGIPVPAISRAKQGEYIVIVRRD